MELRVIILDSYSKVRAAKDSFSLFAVECCDSFPVVGPLLSFLLASQLCGGTLLSRALDTFIESLTIRQKKTGATTKVQC